MPHRDVFGEGQFTSDSHEYSFVRESEYEDMLQAFSLH